MKAYREVKLVYTGEMVEAGKPINDPKSAARGIKSHIGDSPKEIFVSLLLDSRNCVISLDTISIGSQNASLVHPREVFRTALKEGACSIIIAHNHPSGNPRPSREDLEVTKRLINAGCLIGIPIKDHLVIGSTKTVSIRLTNPEIFKEGYNG